MALAFATSANLRHPLLPPVLGARIRQPQTYYKSPAPAAAARSRRSHSPLARSWNMCRSLTVVHAACSRLRVARSTCAILHAISGRNAAAAASICWLARRRDHLSPIAIREGSMEQGGLFCCELLPRPVDRVLWGKATRPLLSFCLQRTHGFGEGACTLISRAVFYPATCGGFGLG